MCSSDLGHNFDIRKQLLEYDDVANAQRKVIYEQRNELMAEDDISAAISAMREDIVNGVIDTYIPLQSLEEQWDIAGLEEALEGEFGQDMPIRQWLAEDDTLHEESLRAKILTTMSEAYQQKEEEIGSEIMRMVEKEVMLKVLDTQWKDHLAAMDHLRQGIHLRGYAQKDPKQEYKRESFELFSDMLDRIKQEVVTIISRVQIQSESDIAAMEAQRRQGDTNVQFEHQQAGAFDGPKEEAPVTYVREGRKVGRNEPCPCGSGKKYKQCHGKLG